MSTHKNPREEVTGGSTIATMAGAIIAQTRHIDLITDDEDQPAAGDR
ncbi:hypothetical protein AB0Y14_12365 [Rothia sp. HC945]